MSCIESISITNLYFCVNNQTLITTLLNIDKNVKNNAVFSIHAATFNCLNEHTS